MNDFQRLICALAANNVEKCNPQEIIDFLNYHGHIPQSWSEEVIFNEYLRFITLN